MILLNVVAKHMYGLKKNSINIRVDYLYWTAQYMYILLFWMKLEVLDCLSWICALSR